MSKRQAQPARSTEPMGIPRDTVRNPPDFDYGFDRSLGPRGTMPLAKAKHLPASERAEAGEFVLGTSATPEGASEDGKIDLSKAHPRFAKTEKVSRRPSDYLPRERRSEEEELTDQRPTKGSPPSIQVGMIAVIVLSILAVVLAVLVVRQRASATGTDAPSGGVSP